MKIFAPSPRIYPSVLNSSAGAATEFAKPVMGTSVPAPACFAMRSYQPRPVRRADKNIKVIDTDIEALSLDKPKYKYISISDCPITHISPPNKNAFGMVTHHFVPWEASLYISLYCALLKFISISFAPFFYRVCTYCSSKISSYSFFKLHYFRMICSICCCKVNIFI